VEVAGDLETLVRALLRHRIRQLSEDLLTLLQLNMRLLESVGAEEHLAGEEERRDDDENRPKTNTSIERQLRKHGAHY